MGNIMTRAAVSKIMGDESMTPEQRTEAVMGLYGRALDDGYVSKTAAQTAQETAISNAKAEWEKSIQKPDVKASDEYKALENEYAGYKAMQIARTSDEYKGVKGKFFETVYGMVDKKDGAKPVADQIAEIRKNYEEYFEAPTEPTKTPQFSKQPGHPGVNPTSEEDKLFNELSKSW
jgi:hypothetical protein